MPYKDKEQQRAYMRQWMRARRSGGMYKAGCRCLDCRRGNADGKAIRGLQKKLRTWFGRLWDEAVGRT